MILNAIQLAACGIATPAPTATEARLPSLTPIIPSITPSITPTITPTITFTSTPDFCNSAQWQDKIQVLSDNLLTAMTPGGPVAFDRILVEQVPAWADFRQNDHGEIRSAGVIFHETSSGPEPGTALNPAVILVTYGVERKWELPANGDLVSEVEHIRAVLYQHRSEWIHGQIDQSQYPRVANAATYALYRYFNGDLFKLENWCRTYVRVYSESPVNMTATMTMNTVNPTPEPDIAPNCRIANEEGQLYLLSDQEFRDLRTHQGIVDQALATHYPEWASYTQMVSWSTQPVKLGEIIVSASLDEEANLQINAAVTLVTLGESLDWQLPSNTDLYLKSQEISTELNRLGDNWNNPYDESYRRQYPEVANSGTFAFYIFFNSNLDRLQRWCNTYQLLFGIP